MKKALSQLKDPKISQSIERCNNLTEFHNFLKLDTNFKCALKSYISES